MHANRMETLCGKKWQRERAKSFLGLVNIIVTMQHTVLCSSTHGQKTKNSKEMVESLSTFHFVTSYFHKLKESQTEQWPWFQSKTFYVAYWVAFWDFANILRFEISNRNRQYTWENRKVLK